MLKWWKRLRMWKKGALLGLLLGAILFGSIISSYEYSRASYEKCYATFGPEKCENQDKKIYDTIQPLWPVYLEPYGMIIYYLLGGFHVISLFGENSLITRLILYLYYGLPTMIIGILIGFFLEKIKGKKKR